MECDTCGRFSSGDAGLHCPACARALLYPHRINQAELLLDKEQLRRRVEATLSNSDSDQFNGSNVPAEETAKARRKRQHERNLAETQKSRERVDEIVKKSENLRDKLEQYKKEIQSRKTAAELRRKENDTARSEAANVRPAIHEQLKRSAKRRTHRYDIIYRDIVTARVCLCREAAELAGLQRHQRRAPDGTILESYTLHGLAIIDLRDLNNTPPQNITASLTSISRLLVQACYYLEIRLPAEITLPGENYPLSTIFTPASSFLPRNKDVPFPGITSSNSSSPNASRTLDPNDQTPQPKLRPLYIDRKLPVLMREDPSQYSYFVEGVSLLAWCIAWLCRTQGLSVANSDWEEICAVGRNLWLLLVDTTTAAQKQQQHQKQHEHKDGRPKLARKGTSDTGVKSPSTPKSRAPNPPPLGTFGVLSHGTAHGPHLLSAATSASPSTSASTPSALPNSAASSQPSTTTVDVSPRTWKFASPTGIRDSLKKYLLNEMSSQEWEVLSSGEFEGWVAGPADARGAVDEDPIVVAAAKGQAGSSAAKAGISSKSAGGDGKTAPGAGVGDNGGLAAASEGLPAAVADGSDLGDDNGAGRGEDSTRPKGSSGWMKLKSRSTD